MANSWTNWGKLKEVWLGDTYPAEYYDHLPSNIRDVFYKLTEITKEDLNKIQKKIESFGVVVQRPVFDSVDLYQSGDANVLAKPPICPRDHFLVYGRDLITVANRETRLPWQKEIRKHTRINVRTLNGPIYNHFCGANVVRLGKDLYYDIAMPGDPGNNSIDVDSLSRDIGRSLSAADTRYHFLINGGHMDACFAVLKPGLILATRYFSDYSRTFPGWEVIYLTDPTYRGASDSVNALTNFMVGQNKWRVPGATSVTEFDQLIVSRASNWVGNYQETYFEVNCLVIDEKNVLFSGENDDVYRKLEQYGITAHFVPFRARTFWDGGLHCLTLDVERDDWAVDLFPDRTEKVYKYF